MLDRLLRARRMGIAARATVVVALTWMSVETVRAYSTYIPYMNQLASARPHWQYLSDSNVEWGDDIGGLAEYLNAQGETRVRAALLGGQVILRFMAKSSTIYSHRPGQSCPKRTTSRSARAT